jgi:hypothetical protein
MMKIGDTVLGALVRRKPDDGRPNLYVVAPGQQHHGPDNTDFNLVVNELSDSGSPVVWDVYWALVLDPALETAFTGERKLLIAAQDGFMPEESEAFERLPAAGFLREYLHINSVAGLASYRREDGRMPRVIIAPAGMAVRASAAELQPVASPVHPYVSGQH